MHDEASRIGTALCRLTYDARVRTRTTAFVATAMLLASCESAPEEHLDVQLVAPEGGIGSGVKQTIRISGTSTIDIRFTPPGGLVELTIDCSPSENTDAVGFSFGVEAPAFVSLPQMQRRAGYLSMRDSLPAALTLVHLEASEGPATCEVRVVPATGKCGPREMYRSAVVGHDHVSPDTEPRSDWETFPSSGNHYPIWAAWNQFYVKPIRTGYLLHDLEHGGIVMTYRCAAPSGSDTCVAAASSLLAAKTKFAQTRVNVAPEPTQPLFIGARAWRWVYGATCYDEAEVLDFMTRRFRHGREDIDSDVVPAFDPTL